MTRGLNELRALPDSELNDHQKQLKYRKIERALHARRGLNYSIRIMHKLSQPTSSGVPGGKPKTPANAA
jgi:hypothetical protein